MNQRCYDSQLATLKKERKRQNPSDNNLNNEEAKKYFN